jgi:hypothetical protein
MSGAWERLESELDLWGQGAATFWWRDDDAVAPTAALDRLLALAPQPLALAVIPEGLDPALADRLAGTSVTVLQHGFAHRNHEPPDRKKAELGAARPPDVVREELRRGGEVLAAAFGPRALPVLVPPWNRISPALMVILAEAGYCGLSTHGPRPRGPHQPGLVQANAHVDIIDWRAGRRFIGLGAAIELTIAHLRARREGRVDGAEPTGLLTHHLVMDAEGFDFTAAFLARTARHPAVQWLPARAIFGAGSSTPPR